MKMNDWVVCKDDENARGGLVHGELYRIIEADSASIRVVDWSGEFCRQNPDHDRGTRWSKHRFHVVQQDGEILEGDLIRSSMMGITWKYHQPIGNEKIRLLFPDSVVMRERAREVLKNAAWVGVTDAHRVKKYFEESDAPGEPFVKHDWVICVDDRHTALHRGDCMRVLEATDATGIVTVTHHGHPDGLKWKASRFRRVQGAGVYYEGDLVVFKNERVEVLKTTVHRVDFIDYVKDPRSTCFREACNEALAKTANYANVNDAEPRVDGTETGRIYQTVKAHGIECDERDFKMIDADGPPDPEPVEPYDWEGAAAFVQAVNITADAGVNSGFPYDPNEDCTRFVPGRRK